MRRKNITNQNLTEEEQDQVRIEQLKQVILQDKKDIDNKIQSIGMLLEAVKSLLPKGEWDNWLKENIDLTTRSANRYIKASKTKEFLLNAIPEELGGESISIYALDEIGKLKKEQQLEFVKNNDIEKMSVREIAKEVKNIKDELKIKKDDVVPKPIEAPKILIEQSKEDNNYKQVYLDTLTLYQELINRTGSRETIEATLVTRYQAKEVKHKQLIDIIANNKLNIPIFLDESAQNEYFNWQNQDEYYSNYEQWGSNQDKYYAIFNKDFEWKEAIKCYDYKDEGCVDFTNSNHVDNKIYQLAYGSDENSYRNLIVYKDYKIIGSFMEGDWEDINSLGLYDRNSIPTENLEELKKLLNKLEKQMRKYEKRQADRDESERLNRKFKEEQKKKYQEALNNWTSYYQPYCMGKYKFEDIWDNKGNVKNFTLWSEMTKFCEKQRKAQYGSYDFGDLFGKKNIEVKEEDKDIYKTIYRSASLKLHPDVLKDGGHAMQVLNSLKEEWGI